MNPEQLEQLKSNTALALKDMAKTLDVALEDFLVAYHTALDRLAIGSVDFTYEDDGARIFTEEVLILAKTEQHTVDGTRFLIEVFDPESDKPEVVTLVVIKDESGQIDIDEYVEGSVDDTMH